MRRVEYWIAMDVDTDNFEEAVAQLEQHLPRATYVAVDLEMTGISGGPDTQGMRGDVPQVRYTKCATVVEQPLQIVQIGLCLFEDVSDIGAVTAPSCVEIACRPFNTFIFPRPVVEREVGVETDPYIGVSSGTLLWLRDQGLDIDRWVSKGVSYTSADVGKTLLKALEFSEGDSASSLPKEKLTPNNPRDIQLIDETMKHIAELVESGGTEMRLPNANRFIALCLRQRIAEKHPTLVIEKRSGESNRQFQERWVLNMDDNRRKQRDLERRRRFMGHLGFRRVWDLLRKYRVPLVVHNGFFDLLFLLAAFEGPLPPRLDDFKKRVLDQFGCIYDTKVLAESEELSGVLPGCRSALPELAEALGAQLRPSSVGASAPEESKGIDVADPSVDETRPAESNGTQDGGSQGPVADPNASPPAKTVNFSCPEGFDGYATAQGATAAFHTAGYDAYETGRIFGYYKAQGGQRVAQFANHVFLMGTSFQLNMAGPDLLRDKGVSRWVCDVEKAFLNNKTLLDLLRPVLDGGQARVNLQWAGDTSLLLTITGANTSPGTTKREALEQALDTLLKAQEAVGRLRFCAVDTRLKAAMDEAGPAAAPVMDGDADVNSEADTEAAAGWRTAKRRRR